MWARKYECCIKCGKTNKEHQAKGLCLNCYSNRQGLKYRRTKKYGGNWLKKILDSPECNICKKEEDLVVHHKDLNKKNNQFENLQTLCRSCHSRLHNYLRLKQYFKKYGFFPE